MKRHLATSFILAVLFALGCSDTPTPTPDAGPVDAAEDVSNDVEPGDDVATDAPADGGVDLGRDTGTDAADASDSGMDARPDSGPDTGPDTGSGDGDGECDPGDLPQGTFDPDCVYLLGTLIEGSSGWGVFVNPLDTTDVYYGFGDYPSDPLIRPSDGKLIVADFDDIYVFEPDAIWEEGDPRPDRPTDPLANDTPIDAPYCDDVGVGLWKAFSFPDGTLAYACSDGEGTLHLEGTTESLEANAEYTFALGAGRRILVAPMDADAEITQNGASTTVTGIRDYERFIAARWIGGRFVAAVAHAYTPWDIEMWEIADDGSASSLGAVQLAPDDVSSYFQDCVLDAQAALYCFTTPPGLTSDSITVFTTNAAPNTIYEENGERVAIHISYLATGP